MTEPQEYKIEQRPTEQSLNHGKGQFDCRICGYQSVRIDEQVEVVCSSRGANSLRYGYVYGMFHSLCLLRYPDKFEAIAKQDRVNFLERRILETHKIDYMKDANGDYVFDNHGYVKLTLSNRAAYEAELKALEAGE